MKPLRGKRVGPQSRPAEFNSSRSARHPGSVPRDARTRTRPGAVDGVCADACTFRGQSATIGSPAATRRAWKVAFGRVSARSRVDVTSSRGHLQPARRLPACRWGPRNGRPPLNTGVSGSRRTSRPGGTGATVPPSRVATECVGECATVWGLGIRGESVGNPPGPS